MNCPHCNKLIHAFTGLQELQKFRAHLGKCRKNPDNIVIRDGRRTAVAGKPVTFMDALNKRAESGQ